jgi:hypothetical protein
VNENTESAAGLVPGERGQAPGEYDPEPVPFLQALRRRLSVGLAAAALAGSIPATTHAGDGLSRLFDRKPVDTESAAEVKSGPISSSMRWWSIPRPARTAARKLAATSDASVTRCMSFENDDTVSYEIHASHRLGLFKRDDFVLTSVSEPRSAAEQRRREQTLRYRLSHIGDNAKKPLNANPNPTRGVLYGKSD